MLRALVALLALAALPVSAHAEPSPMFEMFKRLCLDTQGEPGAVAKASVDWTAVDQPPPLQGLGAPFDAVSVRSRPSKAESMEDYLLVAGVHREQGLLRRTCTLAGPEDPASSAATRIWTGDAKPIFGGDELMASYLLIDTPTGRRAATPAEAKDDANATRLISVTVSTQLDLTMLSLTRFVP
jgi:hypothetical protein